MRPTAGAVLELFQRAPQREAGLDVDAITPQSSSTPRFRSDPDVTPRARSAPRGATTLAHALTLARHAEHAPTLAPSFLPKLRWSIPSLSLFSLCNRQPTQSRSRRTNTAGCPGRIPSLLIVLW